MIHVDPAPEPEGFDAKVRQPGLYAIAEMTGTPNMTKRPGRPRKVIADSPEEIPPSRLPPFWTVALPDLRMAYDNICNYIFIYIETITGAASVDHMLPKSTHPEDVYEWHNYRLACSLMNSRKNDFRDVLDPFEVEDGWFEIEMIGFQVVPGNNLKSDVKKQVNKTIERLRLNDRDCRGLREEYYNSYMDGDIKLRYLRKRAPFLAMEMERQGLL